MAELRYVCQLCEKRLRFALIIHAMDAHGEVLRTSLRSFYDVTDADKATAFRCELCGFTFGSVDLVHVVEEHYNEFNERILKALYTVVREDAKKE